MQDILLEDVFGGAELGRLGELLDLTHVRRGKERKVCGRVVACSTVLEKSDKSGSLEAKGAH